MPTHVGEAAGLQAAPVHREQGKTEEEARPFQGNRWQF